MRLPTNLSEFNPNVVIGVGVIHFEVDCLLILLGLDNCIATKPFCGVVLAVY